MSALKDETGHKYGRLLVLELDKEKTKNKKGTWWKCKCDCGNETIVEGYSLRSGHTTSCGCYHKERFCYSRFQDLTGQRFGKLIVLEQDYKAKIEKDFRRVYYKCQCDCGNIITTNRGCLISGDTTSCGCIKSKGELKITQILKEHNIIFEQQKTFDTCRFPDTNALARFDFYLPEYNTLIEYDGRQHFDKNNPWYSEYNILHDQYKNQWCKENNVPLIRIPYTKYETLCIEDLLIARY